jgi:hypothetical protein
MPATHVYQPYIHLATLTTVAKAAQSSATIAGAAPHFTSMLAACTLSTAKHNLAAAAADERQAAGD